ncbi:MAG: flagellin biosynthesis protein FlgE, partial [Desulfobacterales bacterium]|nr:flagellin biosynthesis protein FlgE [Desulfobacterales bacterium]
FFVVSQPGSDEMLYTRAGNFSFDDSGALVNPSGYVVQGWNVDPDTGEEIGAMTDLILDDFNSPPKETEELTVVTNLDADAESNSGVLSNSYTYEAGETTAVSSGSYE